MARTNLQTRVQALREAVDASEGRLSPEVVQDAEQVLARAEERLQLSAEHTVVALAGATGAGKSAIFNRLVGSDIARTGRQRPTTAFPMAVVAENPDIAAGSDVLLRWLGVNERHNTSVSKEHPNGLILLDLPDHDSVVTEHRMRADRVTERADLLIWVTSPQKYADGILHNEYLAGLKTNDASVVILLNQVDRLDQKQTKAVLEDLKRLVREDGLDAKVLATSAISGEGLDQVQALISRAVIKREASTLRMTADVRKAARSLLDEMPTNDGSSNDLRRAKARLLDTLDDAAGVPIVVEAVRRASVRDAVAKTGWPPVRWLRVFRSDPLRVLGLRPTGDTQSKTKRTEPASGELVRSSLPTASPAVRARVNSATRAYVEAASKELTPKGTEALNQRVVDTGQSIPDDLDREVVRTVRIKSPAWWSAVDLFQWLFVAVAAVGGIWLLALAVMEYLRIPTQGLIPTVELGPTEMPWPTLLLLAGIAAGVLLALISRILAGIGARRRANRVRKQLRSSVEDVANRLIVHEVDSELDEMRRARNAAAIAAA